MKAFVDSSVIARKMLGEPKPLKEWKLISAAFASRLLAVELRRLVDRCRLDGSITDDDVALLQAQLRQLTKSIALVAMSEPILELASSAMPTVVGSLDAIHLATAIELRRARGPLAFMTHDVQLGRAAAALGFDVYGVA